MELRVAVSQTHSISVHIGRDAAKRHLPLSQTRSTETVTSCRITSTVHVLSSLLMLAYTVQLFIRLPIDVTSWECVFVDGVGGVFYAFTPLSNQ